MVIPTTTTPIMEPYVKEIPFHSFDKRFIYGWICPKCGSSNNPSVLSCPSCYSKHNKEIIDQNNISSFTVFVKKQNDKC